jgi:hypothetical protein
LPFFILLICIKTGRIAKELLVYKAKEYSNLISEYPIKTESVRAHDKTKKNPLKNKAMMLRLNPFAKKRAELIAKREADRHNARAKTLKDKRSKAGRAAKHTRTVRDQGLNSGLVQSFADADAVIAEEIRQGAYQPGDSEEEEEDN